MNRKLKRYLEEEERTVAKIAELQDHLKTLRIAKKQEEDTEIIRSIRGMKLDGRTLFNVLNGIQDGGIDIQAFLREAESHSLMDEEMAAEEKQDENTDALKASESEDDDETEK